MKLVPLEPAIQRYPWGSSHAIPSLFGWSSDGQPIAELWYGDHPRAPSTAFDDSGPRSLDELLVERPALGGRLRFLLKLLAAAAPLSLQCHPDGEQAARGFADEEARGVAQGARDRRFADPRAKPEMIVALGRFEALAGVLPADAIRAGFGRLAIRSLDDLLPTSDDAVAGFVAALLGLPADRRARALAEAAQATPREPSDAWVARLIARYPDDVAALAPLFLHYVDLAAGQAIHLEARRLHAYLAGLAIELMGPSDNVLRAGLTDKHVDLAALLAIADLSPAPPRRVVPSAAAGIERYRPAGTALELDRIELTGTSCSGGSGDSARAIVALRGDVSVAVDDAELEIGPGDACLIGPGVTYVLRGRGSAIVAGAGAR